MHRLMLIMGFLLIATYSATAQESYDNPDLGIAFTLPDGWEVQTDAKSLMAATPETLAILREGGVPEGLVLRMITGTFLELEIQRASDLPERLQQLVPVGTTAPEPTAITYGNNTGWEIEYSVADSGFTSRVALLSLENGRVALIRGIAATSQWEGAAQEFESLTDTLVFSTPAALEDPLAHVPDGDGGVLWHYQAAQPDDTPQTIRLGGVTFDPFLLTYIAAGPRGVLVLDQTDGRFVNYLGPFFDDDNIVDLDISADARLFAANATPGDNNQVMIINRAGAFEYGFGSSGDGQGQFAPDMPQTLAVTRGREPSVWVVSEGHATEPIDRLYRFDRWGNLQATLDLAEINPNLHGVMLDVNVSTGAIYLVGESGGLNILDANGNPLVTNLGTQVFNITNPVDVTIAPGDNIIVATDSEGFLQFAPSGELLDRFGLVMDADSTERFRPSETIRPAGLVVGPDSTLYFAETNPTSGFSQVQAFRFTGDGNLPLPNRPGSGQAAETALNLNPADGGGAIEYGQAVQGNLNNQYSSHEWRFQAQAGDRIRITMRDISPLQKLDTLLILMNSNYTEIANNDDIEGDIPDGFKATDSVLEMEIRAQGTYIIKSTRFGERGEYELSLELLD